MNRISRRIVPAFLLACVIGGCDSPLGPSDVEGTYVLERVGSAPLPAVINDIEYGTFTILVDSIRLEHDGSGSEVQTMRVERREAGAPTTTETMRNVLGYQLTGGRDIEIGYSCGPAGTLCALINSVPAVKGRVTSGGLALDVGPEPYIFRRVD
ncbi:MAG TPA: hypothetical protein VEX86_04610 [Longimicrobium sp.]|nr:hypothetical protein [Longimicrobium sp.]